MLRWIAGFFISPLLHLLLLGIIVLALHWFNQQKAARLLTIYAGTYIFVVGVSPLPEIFTQHRESLYHPLSSEELKKLALPNLHIVVLGAGHSNAPDFPIHDRLSEPALKRLLEGFRIQRAIPDAKLICSGFSSSGRQSQADALAEMALTLGVSPADTLLQPHAFNTEAEARDYHTRFGANARLVVVTSALHMPRAMFWFQHYGLEPIPAPTDHLVMQDPAHEPFAWKPSLHKLEMTQKLLHEYVGMLYAKFKVGNQR